MELSVSDAINSPNKEYIRSRGDKEGIQCSKRFMNNLHLHSHENSSLEPHIVVIDLNICAEFFYGKIIFSCINGCISIAISFCLVFTSKNSLVYHWWFQDSPQVNGMRGYANPQKEPMLTLTFAKFYKTMHNFEAPCHHPTPFNEIGASLPTWSIYGIFIASLNTMIYLKIIF